MIESMAVGPLMWNIDVLFFKSIFRISRKFKLKPLIITGFVSLITANGKASIDSGLIGVDRQKYNCSAASLLKNSDCPSAPFNFIFIGGISSSRPYKGAENLVSIFKRFFDEYAYENVYITFIGGGDLLPKVRLQAQEYNNIRFKENLSDDLLLYELCKSDVLILPSISDGEGFGRVALEAISCKRAVLVSKFAGISELIEKHKAGLVFDPLDIMDSIDKIKFIVDNRLSLKYYIENASNMIESEGLDLISSTKRTIKIYEEFSTLE